MISTELLMGCLVAASFIVGGCMVIWRSPQINQLQHRLLTAVALGIKLLEGAASVPVNVKVGGDVATVNCMMHGRRQGKLPVALMLIPNNRYFNTVTRTDAASPWCSLDVPVVETGDGLGGQARWQFNPRIKPRELGCSHFQVTLHEWPDDGGPALGTCTIEADEVLDFTQLVFESPPAPVYCD